MPDTRLAERLALMVHPSLVFRIQRLAFLCLSGVLGNSLLLFGVTAKAA